MGTLGVDVDGFRVRLATLRGARVRALPGAIGDTELAISRRDGDYVFGAAALKRLTSHPLESADGLGALIGASTEEIELVTGWRGKPVTESVLVLGKAKIKLHKAVARALGELVDPAVMLMGEELDRLVLTVPDADERRDAWGPIIAELGVAHVEIVDRFVAALYAARKAHGFVRPCLVDVGRLGVRARIAEQVEGSWVTRTLERDPCEGLLAVETRIVETLRADGEIPVAVESTAMLRDAAAVLHRDLSGRPRDARNADGKRIVPDASYPLPYVALGGTRTDNLTLDGTQLDRAYDELIRTLRKMCVRLAREEPDVVVLFGPGASQPDVRTTVSEVFEVETHVLKPDVVMGAPLVPTTRKEREKRETMPARAAPHRVRFSVEDTDEETVEIEASQASMPASARKSSPGVKAPSVPPRKSAAPPPRESVPPRASSPPRTSVPPRFETVPPAARIEVPAKGTIRNPTTPEQLVEMDLDQLVDPASVPQLLFGVARARFSGIVELELDGFETARLLYREGRPEWMLRERKVIVESLKSARGSWLIEPGQHERDRSRTLESTHALVTDAVRKLVWTFDEEEFIDAFTPRLSHSPRVMAEEKLLFRRGFRRPEVRFAIHACKGEEPLEQILTRGGLGPRGMLYVIATLQLFGVVEWIA